MVKLEELYAESSCGINDAGIKQCKNIKILNINNNHKITNINFLVDLQELDACGSECGIDDKGMEQCKKIKKLNVHLNDKISDVEHLVKLKYVKL